MFIGTPFTNPHITLYIDVQGTQVSNRVYVFNLTFRVRSEPNHSLELSSHEVSGLVIRTQNKKLHYMGFLLQVCAIITAG